MYYLVCTITEYRNYSVVLCTCTWYLVLFVHQCPTRVLFFSRGVGVGSLLRVHQCICVCACARACALALLRSKCARVGRMRCDGCECAAFACAFAYCNTLCADSSVWCAVYEVHVHTSDCVHYVHVYKYVRVQSCTVLHVLPSTKYYVHSTS